MSTDSTSSSPALGSRENFWGDDPDPDPDAGGGHREVAGTGAASYVAHQLALRVVDPVCRETGRELDEPSFYLPKQVKLADGQYLEYRSHRLRRRVEPESGRINFGESTGTDVPEFGYETYRLAVHTYLAERDVRLTEVDEYLERAECFWHDPQYNSVGALRQLVAYVREHE
jgi:hypothetical protein